MIICVFLTINKASFRCSSFIEVVGIIVSFLSANRNNINATKIYIFTKFLYRSANYRSAKKAI